MIIDFTVRNYLSIKNEISLSFVSNHKNISNNIKIVPVEDEKYWLYTFSAMFGPNASGKTNIIKALSDFVNIVIHSHKLDLDESIPSYKPFRLEKNNKTQPTFFEMEFVSENIRYIYSIEFLEKEIVKEELDFYPEGRKANLFKRIKGSPIKYGNYFKGEKKSLETFLLKNRLLVSLSSNSNNAILRPVYRFFRDVINIHVKMDSSHELIHSTTLSLRDNKEYKKSVQRILKAADISVADIKLIEDENIRDFIRLPDDIPEKLKKRIIEDLKFRPFLGHFVFDNEKRTNQIEYFDLDAEESTGTIKMYDIASEIINALKEGKILIIDEFNSGLHPQLNKFIVNLFLDKNVNKNGAQLLISTHDTCVLDLGNLKREQIWFTDKDEYGATELYSLDEFDKNLIRDNSQYSKYYLDGRFKAVPATNVADLLEGLT